MIHTDCEVCIPTPNSSCMCVVRVGVIAKDPKAIKSSNKYFTFYPNATLLLEESLLN
jgi:hypothetical protein